MENGPENKQKQEMALERLIFFSDAVFAIAITLLALEIRLPAIEGEFNNIALTRALFNLWPKYLGYVISFLVIGFFWSGHQRKFGYIKQYDRNLIFLNLLLLLVIAFIPFPASVISEFGNRTATIFYALVMILAGCISAFEWMYASNNNRLIDVSLSNAQRRKELLSPLIMSAIFALSIGIAFINDDLAKASWILVMLSTMIVH